MLIARWMIVLAGAHALRIVQKLLGAFRLATMHPARVLKTALLVMVHVGCSALAPPQGKAALLPLLASTVLGTVKSAQSS